MTSARATSISANKVEAVEAIRALFDKSSAAVLLDFRGLSVLAVTDLREKFREAGVDYKVVKNTLVRKAIEGTHLAGDDGIAPFLSGPTAIAWSFEDPSGAAKIVKEYRKDDKQAETLQIKCGVLGEVLLSAEQVESQLATLPGKDEIRATLLATMQAAAQNLVAQLHAPGQNFAYVLSARQRELG